MEPSARRSRLRWVASLLICLALVPALLYWEAARRSDAAFAHHEAWVAERTAAWKGRDTRRPVFEGDPVEGNAWDPYRSLVPKRASFGLDVVRAFDADEWALLREGTRRTRVDAGVPVVEFYRDAHADESLYLSGCLQASVDRMSDPEVVEGLPVLLAATQDLGRGGTLRLADIQRRGEIFLCLRAREALTASGPSAAILARLAKRLEAVEEARPDLQSALTTDDLHHRRHLVEAPWNDLIEFSRQGGVTPSWRVFFSRRILRAQALNGTEAFYARFIEAQERPASERFAIVDEADAEARRNPLLDEVLPVSGRSTFVWATTSVDYDATARLWRVLLRIGVALQQFQAERASPPPSLEALIPTYLPGIPSCPVSGKSFRYSDGKVWSVGADGVDDGGAEGEGADAREKDVVWNARRK